MPTLQLLWNFMHRQKSSILPPGGWDKLPFLPAKVLSSQTNVLQHRPTRSKWQTRHRTVSAPSAYSAFLLPLPGKEAHTRRTKQIKNQFQSKCKIHTCNPSPWEVKTGDEEFKVILRDIANGGQFWLLETVPATPLLPTHLSIKNKSTMVLQKSQNNAKQNEIQESAPLGPNTHHHCWASAVTCR